MADDRPSYRPRRAFVEAEPTPDNPAAGPTGPSADESPSTPQTPGDATTPSDGSGPGAPGRFTEDEARPIFREDAPDADASTVRTPNAAADAAGAGTGPDAAEPAGDTGQTGEETRRNRLSFAPRQRPADAEATTLLPRTAAREERVDPPFDDDLDESPRRLGRRGRLALLVGAVAAVIVVGLAIGYAVVGVQGQPGAGSTPVPSTSSSAGTPSAAALLDDSSMLTPQGAQGIDGRRTWTVAGTVRGPVPDGSGPACLGSDPLEGAPTAQQTITRTLTSSGSNAPGALHIASAYATAEDATQAFAVTSRTLGTCALTGDWLFTGRTLQGVGDESAAAAVISTADGATRRHWVVVSRTGRALDVVDASTPAKSLLDVNDVVQGLASVVGVQCQPAGGTCPASVSTKDAPPPVGGDEPGFLAVGDLPPAGSGTAPWVGTPVEAPSDDFSGSQCESVNWSTTSATDKSSRVYLLQDVPGIFGLNEIVLTVKDADTASKLVDKIRGDWTSCKERKLTASVDSPTKVTGVAADGSAVSGWTTGIEQKAGSTTTRFRVGIASSGNKVAFVFLNPQKGLDVDGTDWGTVAVRAVQRMTQQS